MSKVVCASCREALRWLSGAPYTAQDVVDFGHRCERCQRPLCDKEHCRGGMADYDELCRDCWTIVYEELERVS